MNPRQFEEFVSEYFRNKGYQAETTSYINDYGIDVFARKGKEKIAIQAKMYGNSTRKINRQMVMELHGAKDYFDCTKAVIVTNGEFLPDAVEVANKLEIEIIYLDIASHVKSNISKELNDSTFEGIWEKYVMPLAGQILTRENGDSNEILKADWSCVERLTSNGNKSKIKIEIFKMTINTLLKEGYISRNAINQNYSGRAASGVILILSHIPFFKLTERPSGLRYDKQ